MDFGISTSTLGSDKSLKFKSYLPLSDNLRLLSIRGFTICQFIAKEHKTKQKKKKKEEERKSLGREDVLLYERFNFLKNLSRCPTFK